MNILIIEDELPAFTRLTRLLSVQVPDAVILKQIDSIQAARSWFQDNPMPDIVFLDIQLADGSGLELQKTGMITCPVVFTTAYDHYALDAFSTSGIDYLLKPIKKEELQMTFQKLENLKKMFGDSPLPESSAPTYKKRFLIRFGEHIKSLAVSDIAYCYSSNKATFAKTFEGQSYPMDENLDTLETLLDPQDFFRINRQYLINLHAIDNMRTYTKARVVIRLTPPVKDTPVVSSERAASFKNWLNGEWQ